MVRSKYYNLHVPPSSLIKQHTHARSKIIYEIYYSNIEFESQVNRLSLHYKRHQNTQITNSRMTCTKSQTSLMNHKLKQLRIVIFIRVSVSLILPQIGDVLSSVSEKCVGDLALLEIRLIFTILIKGKIKWLLNFQTNFIR